MQYLYLIFSKLFKSREMFIRARRIVIKTRKCQEDDATKVRTIEDFKISVEISK